MTRLYTWQECAELDATTTRELYRQYVNGSQVDLLGLFEFGRDVAVSAEGMYIATASGRRVLDFTGGFGVLSHGHNHPGILAARAEFQRQARMEVHKNFVSQYVAGLSHNIARLLPEDLDVSYFCNSGAEAVEGAMKLAYKFHEGRRRYVLHSDISFHGNLLGAGSITASPERQFPFPGIPNVVSFPYDSIEGVRREVEKLRRDDGESDVYAVVLEPFSASSMVACSDDFLVDLRRLCSDEGIVLVFDEVYTGWAKAGPLFYFMKSGVVPDVVAMSKALGGGKSSISCYTAREHVFRAAYDNVSDLTLHSTTYNGFGEECVTAIEAINIVVDDDYVGRSDRIGSRIGRGLAEIADRYPDMVDEVRGDGALYGLVLNAETSPVVRAAANVAPGAIFHDAKFFDKLVTSAVVAELYRSHDVLTFFRSNREIILVVSPALIATDDELDYFLDALDKTLAVGKLNLVARFARDYVSAKASGSRLAEPVRKLVGHG